VALNTSWLYVGQALGSWLGGVLFDRGLLLANGYVAAALMLAGLMALAATRRMQ
jgi:predicted MFS family arabinose efflux permease